MPSVAFLLFLLAPAGMGEAYALAGREYAQLTIQRRIIIRVPVLVTRRPGPAPQQEIEWKEKKAGRCLPMKNIVGAAIKEKDSVDLILSDQRRVRAKLDSCRSADFYQGFYMEPTGDELLCADRDVIHARSGAICEIEAFRRLVVEK
ncbi:hypothetical protein [Rhizorhapis suberifaciens]|uniref:Uncharacterized protein n=1 Tax=Rhizorhapis suberifaciens TaxID=13656 RepID=A0A840HQS5_9SPHN|nr:hypothetical protein [Rhizorhapis suberifaciens]MBB4640061.1 hypothetical protein [Rhizorhapis suberifaciens]